MRKLKQIIKDWLLKEELELIDSSLKNLQYETNKIKYTQADTIDLVSKTAIDWNLTKSQFKGQNDRNIKAVHDIVRANEGIEKANHLVSSMLDLGVDVHRGEENPSWAVICISGKPEYVKFVSFSNKDGRHVLDFLKQFENTNRRVVDAPFWNFSSY